MMDTLALTPKQEQRFWAKVDKSGDCWVWMAARHPKGYGVGRCVSGNRPAHRIAFALFNGPIEPGIQIDHICHNKSCVNPKHLRPTTHKQNQENRAGVPKNNTSGVLGVRRSAQGYWRGQFDHNKRRINVGTFRSLSEAKRAVEDARNALYTHNTVGR